MVDWRRKGKKMKTAKATTTKTKQNNSSGYFVQIGHYQAQWLSVPDDIQARRILSDLGADEDVWALPSSIVTACFVTREEWRTRRLEDR